MTHAALLLLLLTGCVSDLQDSRFRSTQPDDAPSVASCEWSCDQAHPWVAFPTDENDACRDRCGSDE